MPLYAHEQRIYGMKHFADGMDNEGQVIVSGTRTLTDSGTLLTTDDRVSMVEWDATALTANRTATLPPAAENIGRVIEFVKLSARGTYKAIIDGYGSETINGLATYELWDQYTWVRLKARASGWVRIGGTGAVLLSTPIELIAGCTTFGSSWLDVSCASYLPIGARAAHLWLYISMTGDGATDGVKYYVRPNGGSGTTYVTALQVGIGHTNLATGIAATVAFNGAVTMDTACVFERSQLVRVGGGAATGSEYIVLKGYGYE